MSHTQIARLMSKCLSLGTRWVWWLRHVSMELGFGIRGWLWNDTTRSKVGATANPVLWAFAHLRNTVG